MNGRPAVGIGIYLSPGANAINTANAVQQTLDRVRSRLPEGVALRAVYDSTTFVNATIEVVIHTILEAFAIVGHGGWEDFYGDFAVEFGVDSFVDFAHAASANGGKDLVGAEAGAGG